MQSNPHKIDELIQGLGHEEAPVNPNLWLAIESELDAKPVRKAFPVMKIAASVVLLLTSGIMLWLVQRDQSEHVASIPSIKVERDTLKLSKPQLFVEEQQFTPSFTTIKSNTLQTKGHEPIMIDDLAQVPLLASTLIPNYTSHQELKQAYVAIDNSAETKEINIDYATLKQKVNEIKLVDIFNASMKEISPFREPLVALSTEDGQKVNGVTFSLGKFKIERTINN
jgi:hypothetical protein